MTKRELTACLLMTAVIAAFLWAAPGYIMGARSELHLRSSPAPRSSYQGVISVWHIVGFRPYSGSLGNWVAGAGGRLEAAHPGLFVEVDSITQEEAQARMERGERADIYSFPLGWGSVELMRAIPLHDAQYRGNLAHTGESGGINYAQPYAACGYLIAANRLMMQQSGIAEGELKAALKSGDVIAAGNMIPGAVLGQRAPMQDALEFMEGGAAAAILDVRSVGSMSGRVQSGGGFPYVLEEYGNFSDMVQLMGISRGMEEEKLTAAYELISIVMGIEMQQSLFELGLVPALSPGEERENEWEEGSVQALLDSELAEIAAPNSFLYGRYKDALLAGAASALAGDAGAQKDFDLRIKELVRGAAIK